VLPSELYFAPLDQTCTPWNFLKVSASVILSCLPLSHSAFLDIYVSLAISVMVLITFLYIWRSELSSRRGRQNSPTGWRSKRSLILKAKGRWHAQSMWGSRQVLMECGILSVLSLLMCSYSSESSCVVMLISIIMFFLEHMICSLYLLIVARLFHCAVLDLPVEFLGF
jgi:hypothetical protein